MTIAALKDAVGLLFRMPLLWIPGFIGGAFAAILWMTLFVSGAFFTSRLVVIFSLVLLFLLAGMLSVMKKNGGSFRELLDGGITYFFRLLLPELVIGFTLMIVFILCAITFSLLGQVPDAGLLIVLTLGIMIPSLMLTFFFDIAAVYEDKRVFESIQRSVLVVSDHMMEVLSYFIISALLCAGVVFTLMIAWEVLLFDKLRPLMDFTEAQREAFTPEQLIAQIGQDGLLVTALMVFLGILILLPLLYSYKACFYRAIAAGRTRIEQMTYGEYDSKGRWYKY